MIFDIDAFPWESLEHKKAFMGFAQYLRTTQDIDVRYDPIPVHLLAAFLIRKNQEAQGWWSVTFGEHISGLQKEITLLRDEVRLLNKDENCQTIP